MTEIPKLKRRWFRFNLRTFLIVLTILCVWLGCYLYRVEQQREAVKWVLENGGSVHYDYDGEKFIRKSQPSVPNVPEWLVDMLGVDCFSTVVGVYGFNAELSDVTPLATLKNLKFLYLFGTQVSDLTPLAGLTNLECLRLFNTQVSDLTPLVGLTNLEDLNIAQTQIVDTTPLAALTNLRNIDLSYSSVSDVTPLAGLPNLERLDVQRTKVSDEEIAKLRKTLPNCHIIAGTFYGN